MKKSLKQLNKEFENLSEDEMFEMNQAILTGDLNILNNKPALKELVIKVLEIAIWLPFTGKGTDLALGFLIALLKGTPQTNNEITK